jgi:SAM-dependent MidA family methyltransferase
VVVDAGAGRGTLARGVLAASPACSRALRYVLVERSEALRSLHADGLPLVEPEHAFSGVESPEDEDGGDEPRPDHLGVGPLAVSLSDFPAITFTGVVLANELMDNLPFGLAVWDGGWREARVSLDADGAFAETLVPLTAADLPPVAAHGARAPRQHAAAEWLASALAGIERGRVVVFDYVSDTASLARRPWRTWLRTYRRHGRGEHLLRSPGTQDITCEVALDQLARVREPDAVRTQAQFLARHGIDELVDEGRRLWAERAATPDLAAVRGRSRVSEAAALTDPSGLGGFTVVEWVVP